MTFMKFYVIKDIEGERSVYLHAESLYLCKRDSRAFSDVGT